MVSIFEYLTTPAQYHNIYYRRKFVHVFTTQFIRLKSLLMKNRCKFSFLGVNCATHPQCRWQGRALIQTCQQLHCNFSHQFFSFRVNPQNVSAESETWRGYVGSRNSVTWSFDASGGRYEVSADHQRGRQTNRRHLLIVIAYSTAPQWSPVPCNLIQLTENEPI